MNEKIESVKQTVGTFIESLEQRGVKLENLQATCLKLIENTKDLLISLIVNNTVCKLTIEIEVLRIR